MFVFKFLFSGALLKTVLDQWRNDHNHFKYYPYHYKNTLTNVITASLKVIRATANMILPTNKLVSAAENLIHYKVILATEKVITAS